MKTSRDENTQTNYNKKSTKSSSRKRRIISRCFLIAAICVFAFSLYNLIGIYLKYKKGDDTYKDVGATVMQPVPNTEDDTAPEEKFKYNHEALLAINPEALGYLYLPAIDISLPFVQGKDNEKYLDHAIDNSYNAYGCPFLDSRITGGVNATNMIIYGHSMKNGAIFGHLLKYVNSDFYYTDGNDVFFIYTGHVVKTYKIFSAYITDATSDTYSFNFPDNASLIKYAEKMKSKSAFDTGVDISDTTQVVTLSTCYGTNGKRTVIQGTFVKEEPLDY